MKNSSGMGGLIEAKKYLEDYGDGEVPDKQHPILYKKNYKGVNVQTAQNPQFWQPPGLLQKKF